MLDHARAAGDLQQQVEHDDYLSIGKSIYIVRLVCPPPSAWYWSFQAYSRPAQPASVSGRDADKYALKSAV